MSFSVCCWGMKRQFIFIDPVSSDLAKFVYSNHSFIDSFWFFLCPVFFLSSIRPFVSFSCLMVLSSIQFSRSVVSDSLQAHESQHARPPCPSPTPGVHSNSSASSRWCHPAISSSVVPFSSCPQSLPASGLFQWVTSLREGAKLLHMFNRHDDSRCPCLVPDLREKSFYHKLTFKLQKLMLKFPLVYIWFYFSPIQDYFWVWNAAVAVCMPLLLFSCQVLSNS